jgi:hypothetical protein
MKRLLMSLAALLVLATTAKADYTLVVPQEPGLGTAVWAEIVARQLSKYTDEPVVVRHIPGARDIPGFNEWHNKLRFDDKSIMVSHGGNGVSFLLDKVAYNYAEYDSIGMMNLDIVMGRLKTLDDRASSGKVIVAAGSGYEPDGMAMAMLVCGNRASTDDYLNCFKQKFTWLNGVKGNEKRLGFMRGEFNTTRETTAAWYKFYKDLDNSQIWFTHGVYDLKTRTQLDDPNFPGTRFETVFKRVYGEEPRGEFYEAYKVSRAFRDVLQKALWVNKGNPNRDKLRVALSKMLADPETQAALIADTGKYDWIVGEDGNKVVSQLQELITEPKLQTLVKWNREAYEYPSVFKPELIKK